MIKKILFLNYICTYNSFCATEKIVNIRTVPNGKEISEDCYYFDFNYENNSSQGGIKDCYYKYTTDIKQLLYNLENKTGNDYKKYYIDEKNVYFYSPSIGFDKYYRIIKKKKYTLDEKKFLILLNLLIKMSLINVYWIFQNLFSI